MQFDRMQNRSPKGNPFMGAAALAVSPDGGTLVAVIHPLGAVHDLLTGKQLWDWSESMGDCGAFFHDGEPWVLGSRLVRLQGRKRVVVAKDGMRVEGPVALSGDTVWATDGATVRGWRLPSGEAAGRVKLEASVAGLVAIDGAVLGPDGCDWIRFDGGTRTHLGVLPFEPTGAFAWGSGAWVLRSSPSLAVVRIEGGSCVEEIAVPAGAKAADAPPGAPPAALVGGVAVDGERVALVRRTYRPWHGSFTDEDEVVVCHRGGGVTVVPWPPQARELFLVNALVSAGSRLFAGTNGGLYAATVPV